MSSLRTRGGLLALLVAAALVVVIGLAAAGAFAGCRQPAKKAGRPSQAVSASNPGAIATVTARVFARAVHPRVADTWGEIRGREFVLDTLEQYGLKPRLQEFIAGHGAGRVHSANVVVVKPGASPRQLVIGAHYDSVAAGEGYVDNATGVALLIELAARLKAAPTPYTLVFVAFGAGERRVLGSRYFLSDLPAGERRATIGMIDLDAAAGGDQVYVTALPGSPAWLRDDALSAAQQLHVPLQSGQAAGGGTVDASNALPFALAGIPTAAFTSGGGPLAADKGGDARGRDDTVDNVTRQHPGRVRTQLGALSRLLKTLLTSKLETHR